MLGWGLDIHLHNDWSPCSQILNPQHHSKNSLQLILYKLYVTLNLLPLFCAPFLLPTANHQFVFSICQSASFLFPSLWYFFFRLEHERFIILDHHSFVDIYLFVYYISPLQLFFFLNFIFPLYSKGVSICSIFQIPYVHDLIQYLSFSDFFQRKLPMI